MCFNTNECGCTLCNSLFNLNRNNCCGACYHYNGWNGCNTCYRRCNYCRLAGAAATNGNGCGGNIQNVTIPVVGKITLYETLGVNNCSGYRSAGFSMCNDFDDYYARQYGLGPFANTRSCECNT